MFRALALGVVLALGTSVLGPTTSASAQSADEQAICKDDAFRICSHTIPDRERTFQCMIQNKDALSPGCRSVMARLLPPEPAPQKRKPASFSRSASTDPDGEKAATRSRKGGPLNLNPPATR
jgi:hypothetical protein